MNFRDILDENEIKALEAFNASESMKQAVKKVLLAGIYENGTIKKGKAVTPTQNATLWMVANLPTATDAELGAELRAVWQGINALEHAFNEIGQFVFQPQEETKTNQAR